MDSNDKFSYHKNLDGITFEDIRLVKEKDRSYGASWKKRGGIGAFMMLARKWDRLEEMVSRDIHPYDIFGAIEEQNNSNQGADGTVLAEIRDLRRYLLLIEAEMMQRGAVSASNTTTRSNAHLDSAELYKEIGF